MKICSERWLRWFIFFNNFISQALRASSHYHPGILKILDVNRLRQWARGSGFWTKFFFYSGDCGKKCFIIKYLLQRKNIQLIRHLSFPYQSGWSTPRANIFKDYFYSIDTLFIAETSHDKRSRQHRKVYRWIILEIYAMTLQFLELSNLRISSSQDFTKAKSFFSSFSNQYLY